jgi:hypothetical protein
MKHRVVVGVPAKGQVEAMFAYDLARLMGFTGASLIPDVVESLRLYFVTGTLIAPQRRDIAATALATEATHILWLDADMRFPKDALARLLQHNKPIVGANYAGRRMPFGTVAHRWPTPEKSEIVYTYPWSTGLEAVDILGFGCLLTATEVFRLVPEPWFPIQWGRDALGEWAIHGEDAGFCEWARTAGCHIYIDHDLSHEVRHIGTFEFTHDHALVQKEELRADGRYIVPETPDPPKPKLVVGA